MTLTDDINAAKAELAVARTHMDAAEATLDSLLAGDPCAPPPPPPPPPTPYITITPSDDAQALIDANPGAEFEFSGVSDFGELRPTAGQKFHCAPGAKLDGSGVVTGWTNANGFWQAQGVPIVHDPRPALQEGKTAVLPLDLDGTQLPNSIPWTYQGLYVDGQHFRRVAQLSQVTDGFWHMDAAGMISLASNPGVVRMGRVGNAFRLNGAAGVSFGPTMRIEHYASPGRTEYGVVMLEDSPDCVFEGSIHGCYGISLLVFGAGSDRFMFTGQITEAGQAGIVATGSSASLPLNAIGISGTLASCNIDRWDPGDEAGGFKGLRLVAPVISDIEASDNFGKGIWLDYSIVGAQLSRIVAERNDSYGVFSEKVCSLDLNVAYLNDNGAAGLMVSGTTQGVYRKVFASGNGASDKHQGQITIRRVTSGNEGAPPEPCDFVPADILITDCDLGSGPDRQNPAIAVQDLSGRGPIDLAALSIDGNRYTLPDAVAGRHFLHGPRTNSSHITLAQWRALGFDAGSLVI